jgi:hypothetical protein
LQELLKRLQGKNGKCAEALTKKAVADVQVTAAVHTPNVIQTMMLLSRPDFAHKQRKIAQKPLSTYEHSFAADSGRKST